MKTKEEVIKEAWAKSSAPFLEYDTEDGFSLRHDIKYKEVNLIEFTWVCNLEGYKIRPKSLQGIEVNNGWIKIKSEEDLPIEEIDVFFVFKNTKGRFQSFGVWDNKLKSFYSGALKISNVTHYQPITKPNPPLHD